MKFLKDKTTFFLACMLCVQLVGSGLQAAQVGRNIEDYKIEKRVDQLLLLIQKRLVIMHEVARAKWNQSLAIEDREREQQILRGLIEQAHLRGLNEKWAAAFFLAQFDAAKEIQKGDFALWRQCRAQTFEGVISLKEDLRTYIDQINGEMIELLSQIYSQLPIVEGLILESPLSIRATDDIEENIWQLAISPLRS